MRHLLIHPHETVRTVQEHVLLLPLLPEVGVEEAQEDVQGADGGGGDWGRIEGFAQGHGPPEHVHTETWGWGWTNQCGSGVPGKLTRLSREFLFKRDIIF